MSKDEGTYKERIYSWLDDRFEGTAGELAAIVGCSVRTVQRYKALWARDPGPVLTMQAEDRRRKYYDDPARALVYGVIKRAVLDYEAGKPCGCEDVHTCKVSVVDFFLSEVGRALMELSDIEPSYAIRAMGIRDPRWDPENQDLLELRDGEIRCVMALVDDVVLYKAQRWECEGWARRELDIWRVEVGEATIVRYRYGDELRWLDTDVPCWYTLLYRGGMPLWTMWMKSIRSCSATKRSMEDPR